MSTSTVITAITDGIGSVQDVFGGMLPTLLTFVALVVAATFGIRQFRKWIVGRRG